MYGSVFLIQNELWSEETDIILIAQYRVKLSTMKGQFFMRDILSQALTNSTKPGISTGSYHKSFQYYIYFLVNAILW